jgi:transcriptional regulator
VYVHPVFKADLDASRTLLVDRGFGTFVAFDGEKPVASHLPFLFRPTEKGGEIELHVARANPLHSTVAANPRVLLTCTGPDAYISPDWYISANQVSTWNYVAVHATGTARIMSAGELRAHLVRLSAHFEERLPKTPWTLDKMDPQRLGAMMNAIVGMVVEVETIEGQWKLGQHKGQEDHDAVVAALRAQNDPGAAAVANLMDEARGHRT